MGGRPRPYDADVQRAVVSHVLGPARGAPGSARQVRNVGGYRIEVCPENARKAEQVDVVIEGRMRLVAPGDAIDAGSGCGPLAEVFPHPEKPRSTERPGARRIPNELNEIAVSLLCAKQNRLAAQILARPH